MKFLFITLFPEQIEQAASHSILKRAAANGLIEVSCINPRDFTYDNHRTVDDTPFGGGAGMVLKPEPMVAAIRKAKEQLPNARVIAMCPGGRTLKQNIVEEYAHSGQDFIFVCGHYEGFDERIFHWVDEKLSIGDYVLTGGEMPALIVMDAIARFIPGVLGKLVSAEDDSFSTGLLEYPQYTRPVDFEGRVVPDVLRSGNHALINSWRLKESLKATYFIRPDLLSAEQMQYIEGRLPFKMKKSERRFYEELRADIAAAKAAAKAALEPQAEDAPEGDEQRG
ncbi:MAG: tRNA (guanosine(37)-N1)-methyltransferase TrmD [Phascolarctobacterium sp.]